jgi:hypothetical protein
LPSHDTRGMQHPLRFLPTLVLAALAGLASSGAWAAAWYSYLTLPSGDEVLLNKQGRALQATGSRAEIDVPLRVRFAVPVASPVGPVHMAGANVIIQCIGRQVTSGKVVPRTAQGKSFASKSRAAAAEAAGEPFKQALSDPVLLDAICKV